jgi:hypothetical protein
VRKEFARVEPVHRDGSREDGAELSGELEGSGASVVPESVAIGHFPKADDFLHSAVAVCSDDENASREICSFRKSDDDVVVELSLRPVSDEVVAAVTSLELLEERAEYEVAREGIDVVSHGGSVARECAPWPLAVR